MPTDPLILYYFSEEMQKEAVTLKDFGQLGGAVARQGLSAVREGAGKVPGLLAKAPGAALEAIKKAPGATLGAIKDTPGTLRDAAGNVAAPLKDLVTNPRETLTKGWEALSNTPEKARAAASAASNRTGRFYQGTHANPQSLADKARAAGWLANVPKYEGGAATEAGDAMARWKNTMGRALPGRKSLFVGSTALQGMGALNQKRDPKTGRELGTGERLGRFAGNVGGSLALGASVPGGNTVAKLIGQNYAGRLIGGAGATTGRAADVVSNKLRGKKPEASPALRYPPGYGDR